MFWKKRQNEELNKPSELGGPIARLCADIRENPDNYEFDSFENIRSKSDHDVWIGRTLSGISMFSFCDGLQKGSDWDHDRLVQAARSERAVG